MSEAEEKAIDALEDAQLMIKALKYELQDKVSEIRDLQSELSEAHTENEELEKTVSRLDGEVEALLEELEDFKGSGEDRIELYLAGKLTSHQVENETTRSEL